MASLREISYMALIRTNGITLAAHSKYSVDIQALFDGHMKSAEPQKEAIG